MTRATALISQPVRIQLEVQIDLQVQILIVYRSVKSENK
jgi:hypothetical protein